VPDVEFKLWLNDCSWKLHWHFKSICYKHWSEWKNELQGLM
jgi:hypothetical protein